MVQTDAGHIRETCFNRIPQSEVVTERHWRGVIVLAKALALSHRLMQRCYRDHYGHQGKKTWYAHASCRGVFMASV